MNMVALVCSILNQRCCIGVIPWPSHRSIRQRDPAFHCVQPEHNLGTAIVQNSLNFQNWCDSTGKRVGWIAELTRISGRMRWARPTCAGAGIPEWSRTSPTRSWRTACTAAGGRRCRTTPCPAASLPAGASAARTLKQNSPPHWQRKRDIYTSKASTSTERRRKPAVAYLWRHWARPCWRDPARRGRK